jgi:fatty acid desaturase
MKIENLIETDDTRRERKRLTLTKLQFLCLGVAIAALAGSLDPWWKSLHVAVLFLVLALILGACKVGSCRRPRRRVRPHRLIALPRA